MKQHYNEQAFKEAFFIYRHLEFNHLVCSCELREAIRDVVRRDLGKCIQTEKGNKELNLSTLVRQAKKSWCSKYCRLYYNLILSECK